MSTSIQNQSEKGEVKSENNDTSHLSPLTSNFSLFPRAPRPHRRDKISQTLAPEDLEAFCGALLSLPVGQRTLARIQALAAARGIAISPMSATAFRDGTLNDYATRLRLKAERAATIASAASGGQSLAAAAETLLAESIFDHLSESGGQVETEEREAYSRILSRARAGDDRARKLASDLQLAQERLDKARLDNEAKTRRLTDEVIAAARATADGKLTAEQVRAKIKEIYGA
jgi:hypothetical protein